MGRDRKEALWELGKAIERRQGVAKDGGGGNIQQEGGWKERLGGSNNKRGGKGEMVLEEGKRG